MDYTQMESLHSTFQGADMKTENSADRNSREKITIKPDELQQAIEQAAAILKAAGADAVYLFGSTVEGPVHPESDIDLAVAGLPPARFFQAMGQTMFVLPRPLDLVDLDVDTPFTRYLKQKGKLLRVA
jgi:predicted nucleotidyltransferase